MTAGRKAKVIQRTWSISREAFIQNGFERVTRSHAYRDHEATIDVLQIEFFNAEAHRSWGTTSHSFGISGGVYLSFAPNPFGGGIPKGPEGKLEPDIKVCAFRRQALRAIRQARNVPQNVWFVEDDLANLGLVAADALRAIRESILPWLNELRSIGRLQDLLERADETMDGDRACFGFGNKGSPVRNLYLGFTAAALGQYAVAIDALTAAMSKGGFKDLSGTVEVDERIRVELYRLARARDKLQC